MINELIQACTEKLKEEPANLELVRLRAILYDAAQLYDKAIADLNHLAERAPSDEKVFFLRSDCYYNKGSYDLAKQDYLRALKIQFEDDEEFVKGYTEDVIKKSKLEGEDEKLKIKKVLEFERLQMLLNYFPQLGFKKK